MTLFCVRPRNITPRTAPIKIRLRQDMTPRKMLKKNRKYVQTWNRRLCGRKTKLLSNRLLQQLGQGLNIFKNEAYIIQVHSLQSVVMISTLEHPCFLLVYFYLTKLLFPGLRLCKEDFARHKMARRDVTYSHKF